MVFGAGSTQAMNTFVQSFLSVYILMVGISPAVAAGVLLVLKGWDAINDMLFGFLVDNTGLNRERIPLPDGSSPEDICPGSV